MNNTYIKMGLYKPCIFINPDDDSDEELLSATVYIDEEKVQILNEEYESLAEIQRHCIPSHELVNCSDFVGHV